MRKQLWCDFETGGLDVNYHSPLSFAMMITEGDKILCEWECNIRQAPLVYEQSALDINKIDIREPGIDFETFRLSYSKHLCEHVYGGIKYLRNDGCYVGNIKADKFNMPLFCGQNTFFDRPWLQRIMGDFDYCYYHRIDTMVLANTLQDIGILPRGENLKLETLCNLLGVPKPEGEYHSALTDVKQTFKCYQAMKALILNASQSFQPETVQQIFNGRPMWNSVEDFLWVREKYTGCSCRGFDHKEDCPKHVVPL